MEKRRTCFFVTVALAISLMVFSNTSYSHASEDKRIIKGVFLDGVDVGGLTVS